MKSKRYMITLLLFLILGVIGKPGSIYASAENGQENIQYVYFGTYPTKCVTDGQLIQKIDDCYEENKYDERGAVVYNNVGYMEKGYSYYECVPIKWRVLENDGKTLTLMTEKILDAQRYDGSVNPVKWADSEIRAWLNNKFYSTAFTNDERNDILETTLFTSHEDNEMEETVDKVYLLSWQEFESQIYGFPNSSAETKIREAVMEDGVRNKITTPQSGDINLEKNTCYYWTRSPWHLNFDMSQPSWISCNGEIRCGGRVYVTWYLGVRPVIRIPVNSVHWSEKEPAVPEQIVPEPTKPAEKKISYKITLNANEGFFKSKPKNVKTKQYEVTYNQVYGELPKPTRTSYTFKGWYTKKTGGTKVTASTLVTSTKKHTLYAQWSRTKYKINYNLEKDAKNNKSNPATYTSFSPKIILKSPTRKGYQFLGWYKNSSFTGKKITSIPKGSKGNLSLYPKWKKITYKITYKLNGGSNNKANITKYTVTNGKILLKAPSRKGYSFKGWYTSANFKSSPITQFPSSWAKNVTLYAKWKKLSSPEIDISVNTIKYNQKVDIGVKTKSKGKITYSSSNPKVLTINKKGVMTGKKPGIAKVTITIEKKGDYTKKSQTFTVIVTKIPRSIIASDINKNINDGSFDIGAKLSEGKGTLTYKSSDEKILIVDKNGLATIKGEGTVTVTIFAPATTYYTKTEKAITVSVTNKKYIHIEHNISEYYQAEGSSNCGLVSLWICEDWYSRHNNGPGITFKSIQKNHGNGDWVANWGLFSDIDFRNLDEVYNALKNGPLICHRGGETNTHFSVIYGYNGDENILSKAGFMVHEVTKSAHDLVGECDNLDNWSTYYGYGEGKVLRGPDELDMIKARRTE